MKHYGEVAGVEAYSRSPQLEHTLDSKSLYH